ncbi:DUF3369 domain-containing protein [Vibrio viridaestus]|uniref:DUF3369 domain-containing protein n=1 Tax=Vibrio viridaestus TaxID=2487322 RepID=A0A3N9TKQ6_9VIBR|nr:DUF3369 domain-containing protein [Vibrio viridaestus]RQW64857.1 DUF3369 domain-containing protein [Vibrio viridaestus]
MELFADKKTDGQQDTTPDTLIKKPWKVLLVDDDEQIHQVTKLALSGFRFQQRKLELISAYSGEEAKAICSKIDDIALALVDVVMESEHAGLEVVKFVREELGNKMIRLVLRTGQAGQAPEDKVIQEYEIDDYKEKTELTSQKLRTLLYSMLRAYRDLCLIETQKEGLSRVIQASANVQNTRTLSSYASTVLAQLTSLLRLESSAFYCIVKPINDDGEDNKTLMVAATGDFVSFYRNSCLSLLPDTVVKRVKEVLNIHQSMQFEDSYVFYINDDRGYDNLLYVKLESDLSEHDIQLLEIYMHNIALTFENINLMVDLQETSKELVFNLSNAVEVRSRETGAHVQRVSLFSAKLARLYGLDETEVTLIQHASPLHDVGKVAIPDSILHKQGKLDAEEWAIMQKHVSFGVDILSRSERPLMVAAKEIAGYHHEKWDGSGYPNGLTGEDIPISGRIVALADVFDALGSVRSYKQPWKDEDIRAEILAQRGKHFDPRLVDLFIENWDEFVAIRAEYPDQY